MRRTLFLITIVLAVISYVSCGKDTLVSPSSVSFTVTHQLNQSGDSLYFFAAPTEDVSINFIKIYLNSSPLDSGNVNLSWSKNTSYGFASEPDSNGVYQFDFTGRFQNGGAAFFASAIDTVR